MDYKKLLIENNIRKNVRINLTRYIEEQLKVPRAASVSRIAGALKGGVEGIKKYYSPQTMAARWSKSLQKGISPIPFTAIATAIKPSKFGSSAGSGAIGNLAKVAGSSILGGLASGVLGASRGWSKASKIKSFLKNRESWNRSITPRQMEGIKSRIASNETLRTNARRGQERVAQLRAQDAARDAAEKALRNKGIVNPPPITTDPYKLEGDPGTPSGPPIRPSILSQKNKGKI